jgi:hypothetical protein
MAVTLAISTNAPALLELANDVFGSWGEPVDESTVPVVRLQLVLHDAEEGPAPAALHCRAHQGYLFVSRGASFGFGDRPHGTAAAFVTPALLDRADLVRSCFIECLGLFLVCEHRRATLHAAAVVHNGRCVLLTGEQGAGKSTLAYACVRAGFSLVAEDIVFAEREGAAMRAWGCPWAIHLLPDAVRFFPELDRAPRVAQMNGECKIEVLVPQVRAGAALTNAEVWAVCSLGRSQSAASCLAAPDEARLRHALTHFEDDPLLDHAAMSEAADRLLGGRTAHLEVGSDPAEAAETLRRWIDAG